MNHRGLEYRGFIEGDDLGKGTVDVAVTEGFAGNIALKTAEGTARQVAEYLRSAMARTWRSRLGYLLARPAFDLMNGLVIKSHGGTDAEGFASAIDLAREMARNDLVQMIAEDSALGATLDEPEQARAATA
jgi:glycerol-3-phosphate acyltransferase PlsX